MAEHRAAGLTGREILLRSVTEREFQAQVLTLAARLGWQAWHDRATNAARRCSACGATRRVPRNDPGWPDLVLVRRPRVVFAELKSERGAPTAEQEAWLDELRACGQEAYVWRPSQLDEIEEVLAR